MFSGSNRFTTISALVIVLLTLFAPIVSADILQSDNFDRTNSDSLGMPWLEDSGDIDIVSNKAQGTGTNNIAVYTATPSASPVGDYTVQADIVLGDNSDGNIICRYNNFENFYKVSVNTNGSLWMDKVVNGSYTSLGSYNGSYTAGVSYTVKLSCLGTNLKAYVNGIQRISATDSTFTAGFGGIRVDSQNPVTFDKFLVEGTPSATMTPTPTQGPTIAPTGLIATSNINIASQSAKAIGDTIHFMWLFSCFFGFVAGYKFGYSFLHE